jgi:hypothetical protein
VSHRPPQRETSFGSYEQKTADSSQRISHWYLTGETVINFPPKITRLERLFFGDLLKKFHQKFQEENDDPEDPALNPQKKTNHYHGNNRSRQIRNNRDKNHTKIKSRLNFSIFLSRVID